MGLFLDVDDSKALDEFAREANWIKVAPNDLFLQQLQETMKLENPARAPKAGFIRPSSLTECLRKLVYEFQGMPLESVYEGTPRIGESGSDAHTRIQNYIIKMKDHGFDVEYMSVADYLALYPNPDLEIIDESANHTNKVADVEKNTIQYEVDGKVYKSSLTAYVDRYHGAETLLYNKKTRSRFKADGIVRAGNLFYILEIKTENSKKYASHVKTLEPHDKHKWQGTYYSEAFQIPRVMFLYENRDTCATFITIYEPPKSFVKKVENQINEAIRYGENGWVAPRTVSRSECYFCPYQKRCNEAGESIPR